VFFGALMLSSCVRPITTSTLDQAIMATVAVQATENARLAAQVAALATENARAASQMATLLTPTATPSPASTPTNAPTPTLGSIPPIVEPVLAPAKCKVLYDFEIDFEGWQLVPEWQGGKQLFHSTDARASSGNGSLKLETEYPGGGDPAGDWEEGGVKRLLGSMNWSTFERVSIDIYVPEEADYFIVQLYLKTGPGFSWKQTPDTYLTPGQWTTVMADLSQLGDASDVREIGVKIGTSQTSYKGFVYFDRVCGWK
jgi:hypothetical protein